ncbi:MAG: hypothetical protein PHD66_04495 [Eubacteriales bacterium]|nr:hypothetical protein [Eubacteriales bacterium]
MELDNYTMIPIRTSLLHAAGISEHQVPECRITGGELVLSRPSVVMIPVPSGILSDAGLDENAILEFFAEDGRLVIQRADTSDYVCDGDCGTCPLDDTDCESDCDSCPCQDQCEESGDNEDE